MAVAGFIPTQQQVEYVQYTNEQLIYQKHEMYIGSMTPEHIEQIHFDWNTGKIDVRNSWYIQALLNVYFEILLNASDNIFRSRRLGIDPGHLEINLSPSHVSIKNFGMSIPIEKNSSGVWKPEFIFSYTNTSSNYEGDGGAAGRFGQGAKICNIYSSLFSIIVVSNGYKYTQYWQNNKSVRSEPQITQTREPNSTTVAWTLDFKRFGMTEYSVDMLQVMANEAILCGLAGKVPVIINGIGHNMAKLTDYASLIMETNERLYYRQEQQDGYIEFCAISTPGVSRLISLCNGIHTSRHGKYMEAVKKALFSELVSTINEKFDTRPKEERHRALVTMASLEGEFSLIINYWSLSAQFLGQFKSEQSSPIPQIAIPENLLKRMHHWSLITRLMKTLHESLNKLIAKTDGKKNRGYKSGGKATAAAEAGGKGSMNCVLFVVEGESAASYVETMISLIPDGRRYIGVLPFRGKFINAMKANQLDLANNDEYKEFKLEMGLVEDPYTDPKMIKKLRYGRIILMGDADVDGDHFRGLVLAMISARFPGLISNNVVWTRRTPQLRVTHQGRTYNFFSGLEYEKWKAETGITAKPKYFKGLGSSNAAQIKGDLGIMIDSLFIPDSDAWNKLHMAFGKGMTEERKQWIANTPVYQLVPNKELYVTMFVDIELIEYSRASIIRAIPDYRDCLKRSVRQALFGCLKYFDYGDGNKSVTVANLASEVGIKTKYHHGNKSLEEVIVNIAAQYIGSGNNAPELFPDGMFGTRKELGKDAASSRYIHTYLQPWVKYLYRKEDNDLLTFRIVEEVPAEPEFFLPVIPRVFNGTKGMGTGWSTVIPMYKPSDIISWYKSRITNSQRPIMVPWFRGYSGRVTSTENNVIVEGIVTLLGENEKEWQVRITEIPIVTSVDDYRVKVLKELYDKGIITSVVDISAADTIDFTLVVSKYAIDEDKSEGNNKVWKFVVPEGKDIYDLLELRKTIPTTNMTFIGSHGIPIIYQDINTYLESFYIFRLPFYQKRKDLMLQKLINKKTLCEQKILLTQILLSYPGNIVRFKKEQMRQLLVAYNLPEILLDRKINTLSEENIAKTEQKIRQLAVEYETLVSKSPEAIWFDDLSQLESHIPL